MQILMKKEKQLVMEKEKEKQLVKVLF